LTLLGKYIIGLCNIQQKKRIKWVERFVVTLNLVFISCGNNLEILDPPLLSSLNIIAAAIIRDSTLRVRRYFSRNQRNKE
jgi:hypothetical protein